MGKLFSGNSPEIKPLKRRFLPESLFKRSSFIKSTVSRRADKVIESLSWELSETLPTRLFNKDISAAETCETRILSRM